MDKRTDFANRLRCLSRDTPARDGLAVMVGACADRVTENAALLAVDDATEPPHQLRVGLRRLRGVARIAAAAAPANPPLTELSARAKWLGRQVAGLRDLDVVRTDLLAEARAEAPDEPGFDLLDAALRGRADLKRAELRRLLRGARAEALFSALVTAPVLDTVPRKMRLAKLAPRALDESWKKVKARARGLDTLTVSDRHELRKALKMLRYECDFLAPLYPDRASRSFRKRLRRLQDVFGALNDLTMARCLLTGPGAPCPDSPEAQRTIGLILGAGLVRAADDWIGARALWHRLAAARKFWR